MKRPFLSLGALAVLVACNDAVSPVSRPVMIQLDSLRAVNDSTLPCCGTVAGALTFYAPTHYDSAFSPGGVVAAGCVTSVPNGELVDPRRGVATSADSVTIPFFGCETGSYRLTVQATGAKASTLVQAGYFTWATDSLWHSGTLILVDTIGGLYWNVRVTGTSFNVPYYHFTTGTYEFQVVHGGT